MGRLDRGEARGSGLLWAWDGMFWVWGDAVAVPFGVHRCDVYCWGMFFVRVNQVLVRLWARCGSKSDRMVGVLRGGLVRLLGGGLASRCRGLVFRGECCVLSEE